ncbi:hypothetical protein AB0O76_07590 [Streptomyces sp. NPDC086554]|uniref:hypothetical protein n=1 Tax=Streptomyces sp. NPDC086554 TaxID=3154864 RepID=UPI00342B5B2C
MNRKRKIASIAAGAVAIAGLGIGPAFAEGGFGSEIKAWATGKDSRHWNDNNRDGVSTTVKFSRCKAHNGGSGENRFKYASLQLKKERSALPDPVVARDKNYCDTSSFGDRSKGGYYFNYSNLNGYDQTGYKLWVKKVAVKY